MSEREHKAMEQGAATAESSQAAMIGAITEARQESAGLRNPQVHSLKGNSMNRLDLILLLKRHNIKVLESPDNVYALNEYVDFSGTLNREWLKMTGKTYAEVMTWLGY